MSMTYINKVLAKGSGFLLLSVAAFLLSGCDSYLDELPDNRTELTSEKKIQGLLTSAYLSNDPLYVAELMSDNMDSYGPTNPNTNRFSDQVYNWQDVTESDNQSPERFWEDCYVRIATANKALEAIDEMGGATTETLRACRGEALLCRAYAHFMLANLFCMAYNKETSATDLGIAYMTHSSGKTRRESLAWQREAGVRANRKRHSRGAAAGHVKLQCAEIPFHA